MMRQDTSRGEAGLCWERFSEVGDSEWVNFSGKLQAFRTLADIFVTGGMYEAVR